MHHLSAGSTPDTAAHLGRLAAGLDVGLWWTAAGALKNNDALVAHLALQDCELLTLDHVLACASEDQVETLLATVDRLGDGDLADLEFFRRSDRLHLRLRAEARRIDGRWVLVSGCTQPLPPRIDAMPATLQEALLVWVAGQDGRCSFRSASWNDFTGIGSHPGMSADWLAFVHPTDQDALAARLSRPMREGEAIETTLRMRHRTGEWRWMTCAAKPRFGAAHEDLGHVVVLRDVHQATLARQRLADLEDRYRFFLSTSREGTWCVEFDPPVRCSLPASEQIDQICRSGVLVEANDALAQLYGFANAQAVLNKRLSSFLSLNDAGVVAGLAAAISRGWRVDDLELAVRDQDDQVQVALSVRASTVDGCLVRAWGAHRDISVQKRYERFLTRQVRRNQDAMRQLAQGLNQGLAPIRAAVQAFEKAGLAESQANDMERLLDPLIQLQLVAQALTDRDQNAAETALADEHERMIQLILSLLTRSVQAALESGHDSFRRSQEKSSFLAAASHDLRQPLHALALTAGSLSSKLRGTDLEQDGTYLSLSVDALSRSLDGILDLSRFDAGAVRIREEDVSLADLFAVLYQTFGGRAQARGLAFRLSHRGIAVRTDRLLLTRLLSNLIDNSIKYTLKGGIIVAVRTSPASRDVSIEVRDSGIGIHPDHLGRVFDEFYQARAAEVADRKGLGLGLSIVDRITKALALRITLRSALGKGTTASVRGLKALAGDVQAVSHAPEQAAVDNDRASFAGMRILVVDDDLDILRIVADLLSAHGATVDVASTFEEGQNFLTTGMHDLALLDFDLCGPLTGVDLVRRAALPQAGRLKIVFVTGDTTRRATDAAAGLGAPVLFKPLRAESLLSVVATFTAGR